MAGEGGPARAVTTLERLLALARRLNAAVDIDGLLAVIAEEVSAALDSERATLFIYDAARGELVSRVATELEIEEIRLPLGVGAAGLAARDLVPVRVDDAQTDARCTRAVDERTGYRSRTLLCMPVLGLRKQLAGVVEVLNKRTGPFTPADEELLSIIAAYAGMGLDNANLADEARRKDRMALVGNMASTIAHDIRNPLTIISGYATLLADLYPDGREYADVIVAEVERLSGMLTELLDYARGGEEDLALKSYDLGAFLVELLRLLERDFQLSGIPIVTGIEYQGPVSVNRNRLLRACLNISNNAREAMEGRGTFTVGSRRTADAVEISFTDTGPGIPREIRERLFTPFVTHGKDAGTGLGLAIARKIVEGHGGSIGWSEGLGGRGTTFTIRLPAPPAATAAAPAPAGAAAVAAASGADVAGVERAGAPGIGRALDDRAAVGKDGRLEVGGPESK